MSQNLTKKPLQIWDLELGQINDLFRQLQDELDEIKGLRGEQSLYGDKILEQATVKYKDVNGQVIHGFGNV